MKKKHFLLGILILVFLFTSSIGSLAISESDNSNSNEAVYLYTGSPLILSAGNIKMLDPANPDICATVVQSRTMVPLRALSEYFGAEVTYDQKEKVAIVKYKDKNYTFPIGENRYFLESGLLKKEVIMDSKSLILQGRTMLPMRAICENIFGKKVSYYNRVIAISDKALDLQSETQIMNNVQTKIGAVTKAGTMKELTSALSGGSGWRIFEQEVPRTAVEDAVENTSEKTSEGSDFSTTNTQVEGIDEADIVKTDGKYIYIAANNAVRIVGADKGNLTDSTSIRISTDKNIGEIYVDDNRLVILGTRWETADGENNIPETKVSSILPYYGNKNYSFIDVYDITDPMKPKYVKGHEMEGYYQSSRKNGEIVYMITNKNLYGDICIPLMRDTVKSKETFTMSLDDIMIMPKHPSTGYMIVSAVNVNNEEKTEVEAITGYGANIYMNDTALYLSAEDNEGMTSIIKFKIDGMKIGYAGSGKVKGYILNQFSMDEYNGNLRVATTTWENENAIYILDESLNVMGSVEGLAKGESIYSVRFMGDKGYVVTFKTVDPLFVFDLSNPAMPKVVGELTIPGFSNYLHPVGENLLLGIGYDTYDIYKKDENGKDIVIGTRQGGIKLSLFDVSDMGKPKEISKYVLGDSGTSAEALYNHKAIMTDIKNGNIAFDASVYDTGENAEYKQGAVIINYEDKKITLKGLLSAETTGLYGNYVPTARRVVYIGEEIYYIQDARVTSYNYETLKQIDTITLQ